MWAVVEAVRGFRQHFWLYKVTVYGRRYVNGTEDEYKYATYRCDDFKTDYEKCALSVIDRHLRVRAVFAGLSHLFFISQGHVTQMIGERLIK